MENKNNKNNNKGKSGLKYLYYDKQREQIEFYLEHGLKPVKTGFHHKTGAEFAAFSFGQSGRIWKLWQEATRDKYERGEFRKNKNKNNVEEDK